MQRSCDPSAMLVNVIGCTGEPIGTSRAVAILMRALVLAAGRGTRLAPLTDHEPKPLIPVAGRPMVHYPLAWLRSHGISEVAVNLHHLGGQIQEALGDGVEHGLRITYSLEPELLGTGGAIRQLSDWLGHDTFVIANADILQDIDLSAVLDLHRRSGAEATLVLRSDPESARYGEIGLDATGRIRSFLGRPEPTADLLRLMFTGVHVLEPSVIERIPWPGESSITQHVYGPMVREGRVLAGWRYRGWWSDAGTHEALAEADRVLATGEVQLSYLNDR